MDMAVSWLGLATVMALFGGIPGAIGLAAVAGVNGSEIRGGSKPLGWLGTWAGLLIAIPVGALIWLAWLSWNFAHYPVWQVAACGITVLVIAVALSWITVRAVAGPMAVCWGLTAGFTTAWVISAASYDSTGLFGVGYMMLTVGGGFVMLSGGTIIGAVRRALSRRS